MNYEQKWPIFRDEKQYFSLLTRLLLDRKKLKESINRKFRFTLLKTRVICECTLATSKIVKIC